MTSEVPYKGHEFKKLGEQAAFWKLCGNMGRAVYVAKTKEVGRIDLSGFATQQLGVINLGGASFGAVCQQIDFTQNEEAIISTFRNVIEEMLTLEPTVRKRGRKVNVGTINSIETKSPEVIADEKAKKLALLNKIAAEKGVQVSPEAIQALS